MNDYSVEIERAPGEWVMWRWDVSLSLAIFLRSSVKNLGKRGRILDSQGRVIL